MIVGLVLFALLVTGLAALVVGEVHQAEAALRKDVSATREGVRGVLAELVTLRAVVDQAVAALPAPNRGGPAVPPTDPVRLVLYDPDLQRVEHEVVLERRLRRSSLTVEGHRYQAAHEVDRDFHYRRVPG